MKTIKTIISLVIFGLGFLLVMSDKDMPLGETAVIKVLGLALLVLGGHLLTLARPELKEDNN